MHELLLFKTMMELKSFKVRERERDRVRDQKQELGIRGRATAIFLLILNEGILVVGHK